MAKNNDTVMQVVSVGLVGAIAWVVWANWDSLKSLVSNVGRVGVGQNSQPRGNTSPQTGTTPGTSRAVGPGPTIYTNADLSFNNSAFGARALQRLTAPLSDVRTSGASSSW